MTRRVVLDTKVLVCGLIWPGAPAAMLDAVSEGDVVLVTSPALLAELRRVLAYPKLAKVIDGAEQLADLLANMSLVVTPSRVLNIVSNESNNRVLEAAVGAAADSIVSDDAGLLDLRFFHGTRIIRPA